MQLSLVRIRTKAKDEHLNIEEKQLSNASGSKADG